MTLKELLEQAWEAADTENRIAVVDVETDDADGVTEPVVIIVGFGKETRNNIVRILNTFLDFEHGGKDIG